MERIISDDGFRPAIDGLMTLDQCETCCGLPLKEEVIRCRDCKWFRANATPYDPDGRYDFCTQFGFDFKGSDGFCAWAERREADHG